MHYILNDSLLINGMKICLVGECSNHARTRGWCDKHYQRWIRHGDPQGGMHRISREGSCHVENCDKPISHGGMCSAHNQRKTRGVDLDGPIKSKRKKGEIGYRGKTGNGYIICCFPEHPNAKLRGMVLEHVVIMSRHLGRPLLPHESVHHKNGIRDDNRLENLELWLTSQPYGQRIKDKLRWAYEIIELYAT